MDTYNANQMDLITQRKQALYSSSHMLNNSNSSPAITGFAEDNIVPVELKDKKWSFCIAFSYSTIYS